MMAFPVATENWVSSQGGLDSGELMNLLPLARIDPRLLYGLVRRTEAILMLISPFHTKYTKFQERKCFRHFDRIPWISITELTVNLKSTDAEWASVT